MNKRYTIQGGLYIILRFAIINTLYLPCIDGDFDHMQIAICDRIYCYVIIEKTYIIMTLQNLNGKRNGKKMRPELPGRIRYYQFCSLVILSIVVY